MRKLRRIRTLTAATVLTVAGARTELTAQVPGLPVAQNAFTGRGLAIAGNFGSGGGQSFYGAAVGWGLGNRLMVSAAAGAQRANEATRGAYGGRAAFNAWTSAGGSLGAGAFVGVGGAPRTRNGSVVTNPAVAHVPVGVSVGYQRPFRASGSLSAYASPLYKWTRTDGGVVASSGAMHFSFGVDVGFSPAFGASVGAEVGRGKSTVGGATGGSTFGAALTYVLGRR